MMEEAARLERMRLRARLRDLEDECRRLWGGHTPRALIMSGTRR